MEGEVDLLKGAFQTSLVRSNSKIKADRAASMTEDTEMMLKRNIEDYGQQITKLKRERDNALDLSGDNAFSLKMASNFDAKDWLVNDERLTMGLREVAIKKNLAMKRYNYLFGERYAADQFLDPENI